MELGESGPIGVFFWLCWSKNRWVAIPGLPGGGLIIYQGNPSVSPKRTTYVCAPTTRSRQRCSSAAAGSGRREAVPAAQGAPKVGPKASVRSKSQLWVGKNRALPLPKCSQVLGCLDYVAPQACKQEDGGSLSQALTGLWLLSANCSGAETAGLGTLPG